MQTMLTYTTVPVTNYGIVRPEDIEAAIKPKATVLISIMHSNNEVGAIQPVKEIAISAKSHGICLHCDAAQSLGKVGAHYLFKCQNIVLMIFFCCLREL